MSTVRKHNGENWISVASSDATGIDSTNSIISYERDEDNIKQPLEHITVEEVLVRHENDLDKVRSNISWLALHGGGGSGGGGGGTGGNVTISFLNLLDEEITSFVYSVNSTNQFLYRIGGRNTLFLVTIKVGGRVLVSNMSLQGNLWATFTLTNIEKSGSLSLTATDLTTNELFTGYLGILVNDLLVNIAPVSTIVDTDFLFNLQIESSIPERTDYLISVDDGDPIKISNVPNLLTVALNASLFGIDTSEAGTFIKTVNVLNVLYSSIQSACPLAYDIRPANELVILFNTANDSESHVKSVYSGAIFDIAFKILYGTNPVGNVAYYQLYTIEDGVTTYLNESPIAVGLNRLVTFLHSFNTPGNKEIYITATYLGQPINTPKIFYVLVLESAIKYLPFYNSDEEESMFSPIFLYIPDLGIRDTAVLIRGGDPYTIASYKDSFTHRMYCEVPDLQLGLATFCSTLLLSYYVEDFNEQREIASANAINAENAKFDHFITITNNDYTVKFSLTESYTKTLTSGFNHLAFAIRGLSEIAMMNGRELDPQFLPSSLYLYVYVNGVIDLIKPLSSTLCIYFSKVTFAATLLSGNSREYCNVNLYELSYWRSPDTLSFTQHHHVVKNYINNYMAYLEKSESAIEVFQTLCKANIIKGNVVTMTEQEYSKLTSSTSLLTIASELNIPVVFIDLSQSENNVNWTRHNIRRNADAASLLLSATVKFEYYTATSRVESQTTELTLLGTSSMNYVAKNFLIRFINLFFKPVEGWKFDLVFNLKADVVDSGHFNNALIGRLINLYYTDRNSGLSGRQFRAVEGFPVLLYMKFYDDTESPYPLILGIYSLTLARESYNTLGIKTLNVPSDALHPAPSIIPSTEANWTNVQYPCYEGDNSAFPGYGDSFFWTSLDAVTNRWKVVNLPEGIGTTEFLELRNLLAGFPYVKYDTLIALDAAGNSLVAPLAPQNSPIDVDSINEYMVWALFGGLIDSLGKNFWIRKFPFGNDLWMAGFYDMDSALGLDNNGKETVRTDLRDFYIPYSLPEVTDSRLTSTTTFIPGTTTKTLSKVRLGNSEDIWVGDLNVSSYFTVYANKLFAICNPVSVTALAELFSNYKSDEWKATDHYAVFWLELKKYLLGGVSYSLNYGTIDNFVDLTFGALVNSIGQMLYNFDFETKYINTTNTLEEFLHGTRLSYVKKWIKNRVYFLDSLWEPKELNSLKTCIILTALFIVSDDIKTICPVILKTDSGSEATTLYSYISNRDLIIKSTPNVKTSTYFNTIVNGVNATLNKLVGCNLLTEIPDLSNCLISMVGSLTSDPDDAPFKSISKLTMRLGAIYESTEINGITLYKLFGQYQSKLEDVDFSGNRVLTKLTFADASGSMLYINTIDISNSAVRVITLPEVPLFSYNVTGSDIVDYELNNLYYLTNANLTGCKELKTVTITNCPGIQTINLGTEHTKLESVVIAGCNSISSITINNNYVKSIEITNCPNLTNLVISSTSLEDLTFSECENLLTVNLSYCSSLSNFNTGDTVFEDLTTLDISHSSIAGGTHTFNNGTSGGITKDSVLDLTIFPNLNSFQSSYNKELQRVLFNEHDRITNLTISGCLSNCPKLVAVYGKIGLSATSIFLDSPNYSLWDDLGGYSNSSYSNYSLTGDIYANSSLWSNGELIDNLSASFYYGNTSVANCFSNTSVTYTLAQVLLNLITRKVPGFTGNVTNISGMFNGISISNLYRNTLINCGEVIDASNLFFYSTNAHASSTLLRILSPTSDLIGFFTPLKKCQKLNGILDGRTYCIDKNIFRDDSEITFKLREINDFMPNLVVDDTNKSHPNIGSYYANPLDYLAPDEDGYLSGDIDGIFIQCPNLTSLKHFLGLRSYWSNLYPVAYIDYSTIVNMGIPTGVTTVHNLLISKYAKGIIDLDTIFKKSNGKILVQNIYLSFIVINYNSDIHATFILEDSTFQNFGNLKQWRTYSSGDALLVSFEEDSHVIFCPTSGDGVIREIAGSSFPFEILQPVKGTITYMQGLFMDVEAPDIVSDIELTLIAPDSIFNGCTKLTNIDYFFTNFKHDFVLSRPLLEANTKISSILYLFAAHSPHLVSSIPAKLFYQGLTTKSVSKIVTDYEEEVTGVTIGSSGTATKTDGDDTYTYRNFKITDTSGTIIVTPVSKITKNGATILLSISPETLSFLYNLPNLLITNMIGCFYGQRLMEQYLYDTISLSDLEHNPSYNPYKYYKSSNSWYENPTIDNSEFTYKWIFDGLHIYNNDLMDIKDPGAGLNESYYLKFNSSGGSINTSTTYMCPPDLLRYCTQSANISYLFANCGTSYSYNKASLQGVTGRICPYLLQSVPLVSNLSYMFMNCSSLGYYYDEGAETIQCYTIPKTFFKYLKSSSLNATGMFWGMTFPANVSLNVFNENLGNTKCSIIISSLFRYLNVSDVYGSETAIPVSGNTVINGILSQTNVVDGSMNHVFSLNTRDTPNRLYNSGEQSWVNTNQKVTFINIFGSKKRNGSWMFTGYGSNANFTNETSINEKFIYSSDPPLEVSNFLGI